MATTQAGVLLRHIRGLAAAERPGQPPDAELLARFTKAREGAAFEALVRRHGALVLGVCRRVLGNAHDAEDAFQATFLTLARSAATIRKQDSLGSWLYGVAYRVAVTAREQLATRRRHERRAETKAETKAATDPLAEVTGRELVAVLDEELARLPERCRVPLVHCYLEGLTCDEAARASGWPVRTLKRRLEEGRSLLRGRLARRGLALPAALLAAGLTHGTATAAVPGRLVGQTVAGALRGGAGHEAIAGAPASVGGAAQGLLSAAAANRLRIAALFLVLGLIGLGVGGFVGQGAATPARPAAPAPQAKTPPPAKKAVVAAGRVVGADGKPLAGAEVALVGLRRVAPSPGARDPGVLAQGKTDADGKFRLEKEGATADQFFYLEVLAGAKGHGLAWLRLGGAAALELKLPAEQVIRGRLFDLQGVAAGGVEGRVVYVSDREPRWPLGKDLARQQRIEMEHMMAQLQLARAMGGTRVPFRKFGGVTFARAEAPAGLAFWPRAFTADKEGRFELRGFGADQAIHLLFEDDRFAPEELLIETVAAKRPKEVNLSLAPAQRIEGRVLYEDSGKPAAGAQIRVTGYRPLAGPDASCTADAEGRFKLNPYSASYFRVQVSPPSGQPYLYVETRVDWPQGAARRVVDFSLPRGVPITGKVVEAPAGAPVAKASVYFIPRKDYNPKKPAELIGRSARAFSAADGSYELVVPPHPGYLLVDGHDRGLVSRTANPNEILIGRAFAPRRYHEAIVPVELKAGDGPREVRLEVRRGVTIKGAIVGPDGKPVQRAVLFAGGEVLRPDGPGVGIRYPRGGSSEPGLVVQGGKFELHGCDPEKTYRVFVLDAPMGFGKVSPDASGPLARPVFRVNGLDNLLRDGANRLGAVAEVSAKRAGGKAATIKLAPCTSAQVRFVDGDGKPSAQRPLLELVVTPAEGKLEEEGVVIAGAGRYGAEPPALKPDAEGRLTIPALIPGATYRLAAFDTRTAAVTPVGKAFTPDAGKVLKLPDAVTP
jgi:RNA polymerase sigma factor (sigma-70 family)